MKAKIIHYSDIVRCPISSLSPSHYNDDGTCLCPSSTPNPSQCAFVNWNVQCTLRAGHDGDHVPPADAFPSLP